MKKVVERTSKLRHDLITIVNNVHKASVQYDIDSTRFHVNNYVNFVQLKTGCESGKYSEPRIFSVTATDWLCYRLCRFEGFPGEKEGSSSTM